MIEPHYFPKISEGLLIHNRSKPRERSRGATAFIILKFLNMIFLQLMLAAFLAFANPTPTTNNSDDTTVTTYEAGDTDGDDGGDGGTEPGTDDGTGGGGTTGNTGQTPPPKP